MKITLFALFTALLMVGCGSPDVDDSETLDKIIAEAIDRDKLQVRGKEGEELFYAPNEQTPYTGWSKTMYVIGQIKSLTQWKDGKLDGLGTAWYENGQKKFEENYKGDKAFGLHTGWFANGQKSYEENYNDGKEDGPRIWWYENGQKNAEMNHKDGKLMSVEVWKRNGEKCPVTNLSDGNGVVVIYNNHGTEDNRLKYTNGVIVED